MSLAVAPLSWPAEAPRPLRPVRVAVVGLGRMGIAHTAVLSMIPDCQVVGFADLQAPLGRSLRGMGFQRPFFRSASRLISRTRPDAVFVCTEPDHHAAIAREALEAGAAVLVEMPLAHTLGDAEAIAAAAAERGLPVACGYNLGYLPVFVAARRLLEDRALGAIRQARSSMYLSRPSGARRGWMYDPSRSGGGVVANLSSQLLALLLGMLGQPVEVRATWSRPHGDVEDELKAMMRLANGVGVGFESSWSMPGYPFCSAVVEVEGENGRLLVSSDALEVELVSARGEWPAGRTRKLDADLPQPARFDANGESFYLQDAAFLCWVTGGPEPANGIGAALGVQRVMDALYRSARDSGAAVAVPL